MEKWLFYQQLIIGLFSLTMLVPAIQAAPEQPADSDLQAVPFLSKGYTNTFVSVGVYDGIDENKKITINLD